MGVRVAADVRDRPARRRRGVADRRHRRRVPAPAGPSGRAARDVGRRRCSRSSLCVGVAVGAAGPRRSRCRSASRRRLETVVAPSPSGMVTFMIVWMRRHAARPRGASCARAPPTPLPQRLGVGARRDGLLRRPARGPRDRGLPARRVPGLGRLDRGRARAPCSGSLVAVAIGWGIYRGGVRLNLAASSASPPRFSCSSPPALSRRAIHTAHEATWLNSLQAQALDLSWLVRPGTVTSSLVTGVLGVQPAADGRRGARLAALRHPDAGLRPAGRAAGRRRAEAARAGSPPHRTRRRRRASADRLPRDRGRAGRAAACGCGGIERRCGGGSEGRTTPTVKVTLTDDGCAPAKVTGRRAPPLRGLERGHAPR